MASENETIADIVAEMRNEGHTGDASCLEWVGAKMIHYADRIEAAEKREREAGAEAAQVCGEIGEAIGREAALSAPQRNCDVGTAEEQSARFDAHCRKHMGCLTCQLRENDGGVPKHCEFAWAQLPYEEGGEK